MKSVVSYSVSASAGRIGGAAGQRSLGVNYCCDSGQLTGGASMLVH